MIIFPIIFLLSFLYSFSEAIKGNKQEIMLFFIFGLSIYITTVSLSFSLGFKYLIPIFQPFKELLVLTVLGISVYELKRKLKFHIIDYLIIGYLLYTFMYVIIPIGDYSFTERLTAFKSSSFFVFIYCAGRLIQPKAIFTSKYFHYILLLSIAAGIVVLYELISNQHFQNLTGYADYNFYFFNFEPTGNYGLSWTFESEGGFKRFSAFFANPLELAASTIISLAVVFALYTKDNYHFKIDNFGRIAFISTLICIVFALSRSSFVNYFIVIYVYCILTKKVIFLRFIHGGMLIGVIYIIFLLTSAYSPDDGIQQVILSTLNFSNPSSVGHLLEWIQGILAMVQQPLGLGLGSSGRIAGSLGENVGGENQFIIIGVQTGVIALSFYLAIYIFLMKTTYKWYYRLTGKEKKVCLAVLLIKTGLIIPALTSEIESSSYISYLTWFLSGLCMSIIMSKRILVDHNEQCKSLPT